MPNAVGAQGTSTAAIRGVVTSEDGSVVDEASVRVFHAATGFALITRTARGRFFVHGLEVGGPYVVEVRRLGYELQRSEPQFLRLGETLELRFVLRRVATLLDNVVVRGAELRTSVAGSGSTATIVSDSLLQRLPTLNRNFMDFVVLTPQVSTKVGFQRRGMSATGANMRFNNYLLNGAEERILASNLPGNSVPLDAVREYQILVAPYDVRYGDFAGGMVSTVSQSGTNDVHGSLSTYWRNDRLARGGDLASALPYDRLQYGFSLSGPIVRDRAHFFVAPEFQRLTSPAAGPYVGQQPSAPSPVPVSAEDVARFDTILRGYGLTAGSGGAVRNESPLSSLFGRVDVALPQWRSRVIGLLRHNRAENASFARTPGDTIFRLSSYRQSTVTRFRLASLQLHSDLPRAGGGHNELHVSHSIDAGEGVPAVRQPAVLVGVPGTQGGVYLAAGAPSTAHGDFRRSRSIKLKDELTLPWGAHHIVTAGVQGELFHLRVGGLENAYGTWTFASLADLQQGSANRFERQIDLGSATVPLRGSQYGAYLGDEWHAGERLTLTLGVRADLLALNGHAQYNAAVDSVFGRRTDEMPRTRVHLSPRLGITWDPSGTARDRLRAGAGIFTGRPPLGWMHPALRSYGVGTGRLACGDGPAEDPPPPFEADYRKVPSSCATGAGVTDISPGDVDLLDPNLRMAQALRGSLAYERRLPWDLHATTEAVLTRYLSDFMWVNLNLAGPQAADRFGRVLYGTIDTTGIATAAPKMRGVAEVIDLQNTSRNYSAQISTRLERRFARGMAASASYTYSRTRDVQSPSRIFSRGRVLWADARATSGRHDDLRRGTSLNDLPHRVVAALTWTAPWNRRTTSFSLYYVGESGSPFTYLATGIRGRGDLNADGSNANDPIYIPRDAADTSEILFSGTNVTAQQSAFQRFIERKSCLRRQRGRIMERNSCREPFSHTTVASVRQAILVGARALEMELDVHNVLNLLNARWGLYRVATVDRMAVTAPAILQHVGQTAGVAGARPIFRFDTTRRDWTTLQTESAFQLQLAVRYRF